MITRVSILAICLLAIPSLGTAQVLDRFNFGVGGGFSAPTDRAANNVNYGWNVNFRGLQLSPEYRC